VQLSGFRSRFDVGVGLVLAAMGAAVATIYIESVVSGAFCARGGGYFMWLLIPASVATAVLLTSTLWYPMSESARLVSQRWRAQSIVLRNGRGVRSLWGLDLAAVFVGLLITLAVTGFDDRLTWEDFLVLHYVLGWMVTALTLSVAHLVVMHAGVWTVELGRKTHVRPGYHGVRYAVVGASVDDEGTLELWLPYRKLTFPIRGGRAWRLAEHINELIAPKPLALAYRVHSNIDLRRPVEEEAEEGEGAQQNRKRT